MVHDEWSHDQLTWEIRQLRKKAPGIGKIFQLKMNFEWKKTIYINIYLY